MRVLSVQPILHSNVKKSQINRKMAEKPTEPVAANPQFRGKGDGALAGLGFGLCGGLLAVGGAAIAGVFVLPTLLGGAAVLAAGCGGAYLGDKIEDKITGKKD